MCDTTFTFGQRGTHFFQCPSGQNHARLPKKLTVFLTSAQLRTVHHVTLGYENSFLLTWLDQTGNDRIESQGLPPELTAFLYATNSQGRLVRDVRSLRLTLGRYNSSFYVQDSTSALWMNLPTLLLTALQSRIKGGSWTDKPRIVALGADDDFLLITQNHAAVWDLGCYKTISNMLEYSRTQERGIEDVSNVALHAYRYQCFIAQSRNGTLIYENLPPHEVSGIESMRPIILQDSQEMERMKSREKRLGPPRRPSLQSPNSVTISRSSSSQQQATFNREGGQRPQQVTAKSQARGLKLSLSLSVSALGISRKFGKILG